MARDTRSNGNGHVDARRLVVPLWASVIVTASIVTSAALVVALYYNLSFSLQRLFESVNSIAVNSWTRTDQELWCVRTQLLNKGWVCSPGGNLPSDVQARPFPSQARPFAQTAGEAMR